MVLVRLTATSTDDEAGFASDYSDSASRASPGLLLTSDDDEDGPVLPLSLTKAPRPLSTSSAAARAREFLLRQQQQQQHPQFGRRKQRRFENSLFFTHRTSDLASFFDANPVLSALCADFAAITLQEQQDDNPFDQLKRQLPELCDRFFEGEVDVRLSSSSPVTRGRSSHHLALVDRKIRPHLAKACQTALVCQLETLLLSSTAEADAVAVECARVRDDDGQEWLHLSLPNADERRVAMGVAQYYGLPFQCDRRGHVKLRLAAVSARRTRLSRISL